MTKIFKYRLKLEDAQVISLPIGAKVLTVQTQDGVPNMWCQVPIDADSDQRQFAIFGTGHAIPDNTDTTEYRYIGTFQQPPFVWHLFEVIEPF